MSVHVYGHDTSPSVFSIGLCCCLLQVLLKSAVDRGRGVSTAGQVVVDEEWCYIEGCGGQTAGDERPHAVSDHR